MADAKRYKITNTTVKAFRSDSKGNDLRPIPERVGHAVQFPAGPRMELKTLYANQSVIVDDIGDAVLKLFRRGIISVDTISNIADELKGFVYQKPAEAAAAQSETQLIPGGEIAANDSADSAQGFAHAELMGSPVSEERLVNPDGEPNFVARAPSGGMKKKVR